MTRTNDLRRLRELLQRRRRDLLHTALGAGIELHALHNQEKDPELEENAQAELADFTLSTLLESQRKELILIDAALRMMDEGSYGECIDCGADIPVERLEALPFAMRCEEDAAIHEREAVGESYAPPRI